MGLIKGLFYQGEYAQVLEKTYEDRKKIDPDNYSFIVGSLIFLGRTEEALAYYSSFKEKLTALQKSYTYFFLAIGLTRRSEYAKAKKYLILNRQLSKSLQHSDYEIKFLVEQGISFFLFFLGQFEKSLSWSQKSLTSALTTQNFWMKSLSFDLLANNLIQNGHIHEGLRQFEESIKFAKKLKNKALIQAYETSHLIFRCEFGIHIQASFEELENKYSLLEDKDAFSKANLGLEYVRQLTLRGQWVLALDTLEEISGLIYQSQNRRQEARLNLRWAEIYFLKNEASSALHYIRSGKRCLEFIDQTYEIQFLGLEIKVYELLKKQEAPVALKKRLIELSKKFNSIKNNNILSRDNRFEKNHLAPAGSSDDEIHSLLLKAAENKTAAKAIILETQFLSWIYRFFELEIGENYLILNFEPKSITCITPNGISHKPQELSTLVFKILATLSDGFTSKEKLVNSVWGYEYDPLRHDSLIYSSFSNIRKILGDSSTLIETSELGYKLKARLVNLLQETNLKSAIHDISARDSNSNETQSFSNENILSWAQKGLNSRQIQILSYLEKNQFISVKNVVILFSTSEITANRDLRALYEKKLVLRIGQGRATHYTLL
jgi:DNA-binding winged helix-turn-helix (wHTH) protein